MLLRMIAVSLAMLTMAAGLQAAGRQGSDAPRVVAARVHGVSLESGLLGDSPDRDVIVCLPSSYYTRPERRFPVVYVLHGFTARATVWTDGSYQGMRIGESADAAVRSGKAQEMILVMPDAFTRYQGSWYVNSLANGNWEDFISSELVAWVDRTWRTIPSKNARGIAGHSMGGYGALYIAMRNPQVFGSVYALSPWVGGLAASEPYLTSVWSAALSASDPRMVEDRFLLQLSQAAAFSPDPKRPPRYAAFPYDRADGRLSRIEDIWQKWLDHDLVELVATSRRNLSSLRAIAFDCGTSDSLLSLNRLLSNRLAMNGISHSFETYNGDHGNRIRERVETVMLPFFSENLSTGD